MQCLPAALPSKSGLQTCALSPSGAEARMKNMITFTAPILKERGVLSLDRFSIRAATLLHGSCSTQTKSSSILLPVSWSVAVTRELRLTAGVPFGNPMSGSSAQLLGFVLQCRSPHMATSIESKWIPRAGRSVAEHFVRSIGLRKTATKVGFPGQVKADS